MRDAIKHMGYFPTAVRGMYLGQWEKAWLVPSMLEWEGIALAHIYGQEAIVTGVGIVHTDGTVDRWADRGGWKFGDHLRDNYTEVATEGGPLRFANMPSGVRTARWAKERLVGGAA